MNQRHSINRGGEQNWINAHKNKNIHGVRKPIFGVDFDKRKFCGQEVIDAAAEKQMNQGYGRRNKKCEKCFTLKAVNGSCMCE
jgi:hypothetical protein